MRAWILGPSYAEVNRKTWASPRRVRPRNYARRSLGFFRPRVPGTRCPQARRLHRGGGPSSATVASRCAPAGSTEGVRYPGGPKSHAAASARASAPPREMAAEPVQGMGWRARRRGGRGRESQRTPLAADDDERGCHVRRRLKERPSSRWHRAEDCGSPRHVMHRSGGSASGGAAIIVAAASSCGEMQTSARAAVR
jgi:hypothetical protein